MRIGIVGAGTASVITAMTLLETGQDLGIDFDIDCIHDPDKPTVGVGESSGAAVYRLLFSTADFDPVTELPEFDGTLKLVSKYLWHQATGCEFNVKSGYPGIHFNSTKFSFWCIERLQKLHKNFSEVCAEVLDITQHTDSATVITSEQQLSYDFVVDCRGFPADINNWQYKRPQAETVNSVIIFPEFNRYDEQWTSNTAHDAGWMFGIPLHHRKAFGFLYNRDYVTESEAEQKFLQLKPDVDLEKTRRLKWNQYHRKSCIDGRILYQGNRLYFYEPSQAQALHYYSVIAREFSYLLSKDISISEINRLLNQSHKDKVQNVLFWITLQYAGDYNFTSDYWIQSKKHAVEFCRNYEPFQNWIETLRSTGRMTEIYPFAMPTITDYLTGYRIDLNKVSR